MTTYDAIIIGGSFAGLSAALQLGRARRSVLVLDAGLPRNRFAPAAHGLLGHDGRSPSDLLQLARADVANYPTVHLHTATASTATRDDDMFEIRTTDGERFLAHRLVLATGVTDMLPNIPGIRDLWGDKVFHCPYCHGYEFRDTRLGSLAQSPEALDHLIMLYDWSDDLTIFTNGLQVNSTAHRSIDPRPIASVSGNGNELVISFTNGEQTRLDALHLVVSSEPNGDLHSQLGCEVNDSPMGSRIQVNTMMETSVPGVLAIGDAIRPAANLAMAISDGTFAATVTHRSLLWNADGAIFRAGARGV